ncbi:MAG: recombinase family protein [Bacteroidetes bacterium]|nr:recombinase family protein [Bacteroidota bacterium]
MTNQIVHCGIYIRKSRESEAKQNYRLEHQREALPKYAENRGWTYEVYDDGIVSGRDQNQLPELQRLINDIKHDSINIVLAIEFSRLSRDETMQDFVSFLATCSQHGVPLSTLDTLRNPANAFEWQMMLLEGSFSAVEMRFILKRLKEGRARAKASGRFLGGLPPFGYRYDQLTRKVVIDEVETATVRGICEMVQTHTYREVQTWLRKSKVPPRYSGNGSLGYLKRMLRYPRLLFYAGYTTVKEGEQTKLVRGEWEALISLEDAEFINRAKHKRRGFRYGYSAVERLLSNNKLLYCGKCGHTMVGYCGVKRRKNGVVDVYDYYICTDMACGNRYFPTDATDRLVEQSLIEQLGSLKLVEAAYRGHQREVMQSETSLQRYRKELDRLWKQKTKVVNLFKEDLLTNEEATAQLRELNTKIDEINVHLQATTGKFITLEQFRLLHKNFDIRKFSRLPMVKKREYIRKFISRIEGDEKGLSVEYSVPVNDGQPVRIPFPEVSGRVLQIPFEQADGLNRRQIIERIYELSNERK